MLNKREWKYTTKCTLVWVKSICIKHTLFAHVPQSCITTQHIEWTSNSIHRLFEAEWGRQNPKGLILPCLSWCSASKCTSECSLPVKIISFLETFWDVPIWCNRYGWLALLPPKSCDVLSKCLAIVVAPVIDFPFPSSSETSYDIKSSTLEVGNREFFVFILVFHFQT